MRSRKLDPFSESCEKKCRRAIAREWRRAAAERRRFSRSVRSPWRARSTFSWQSVALTSARLLAVEIDAFAALQAWAAEAAGAATRTSASARASAVTDQRRGIHYFPRNPTPEL